MDPFGWQSERADERRAIVEYERDAEMVLAGALNSNNYGYAPIPLIMGTLQYPL